MSYSVDLPQIGRAQLGCLIALYVTQPATAPLIAVTCEKAISQINMALIHLLQCGLVKRKTTTYDDCCRYGGGRRPWIYRLTDNGNELAGHLSRANECLRSYRPLGPERNRVKATASPVSPD